MFWQPVAAGVLVLEVVEELLEQPGVGGVADALVADQHLRLVHDLGPGQMPEGHLVLAPAVDPDVDQRAAFERHVVGGDDGLDPAAGGDVHVRLHLVRLERVPVGLGLDQRGPQLARPFDPDHAVRAPGRLPVRQRHLGERLHPAGRCAEPGGRRRPNSGTWAITDRTTRWPRLALAVALERRDGEQPGGAPRFVVGEALPGRTGEGDLLLRRTGTASGLGRSGGAVLRRGRGDVVRAGAGGLGGDPGGGGGLPGGLRQRGLLCVLLPLLLLALFPRILLRRVIVDVDAVVGRQPREPRRVPLADGAELPLPRTPVQLAEDDRTDLVGLLHGEPDQAVARAVREGEAEVVQLAEAGSAVAAGGDDHLVDLLRHGVQIEADPVLAAVGRGCLAEELHASVAGHRVVVEAEVDVAADLPVAVEQQYGDVGVALTRGAAPPQADHHRADVLAQRRKSDIGALDHLVHEAPQMHSRSERTRQPAV
ncbi:hypothetical protein SMICM17S_04802 [Streptomyces microflavus]